MTKVLKSTPRWMLVLIVGFASLGLGYWIGYDIGYEKAQRNSISNFEECAAAGYPIQESFPEVCRTPDGKSFTNTD